MMFKSFIGMTLACLSVPAAPQAVMGATADCTATCLESIGTQYRSAYIKHDRSLAPFAQRVRFTENNVLMPFSEGSWDAVTAEVGPPALMFSDPITGGVGIYMAVMMKDTPGFLAVRLKVHDGKITEVEHLLSTKRGVSGPPTPFGDVEKLVHDPVLSSLLTPAEMRPRAELIRLADGYFKTLARNDGTINTTFSPTCHRIENGMETAPQGCEGPFRLGTYRFNERVRREPILVDEARGLVMFRAFIDHKGVMTDFKLTDGTPKVSPFQEPHTWSMIETFKVKNGLVGPVETDFIDSPYYSSSPWSDQQ